MTHRTNPRIMMKKFSGDRSRTTATVLPGGSLLPRVRPDHHIGHTPLSVGVIDPECEQVEVQPPVVHGNEVTQQAVEDWHYWLEMGYEF